MPLTTDANLLRFEPNLFTDIQWLSQRLLKATGAIASTTLTISAFDTNFDGAQLAPGMVILINTIPHEVISKLSSSTAQLSRLRACDTDPILTPAPVTGAEVILHTFLPQIAIVSDHVFRALGLDPAQPATDANGAPSPLVTDPASLGRFATLSTLTALYLSAADLQSPDGAQSRRAARYQQLATLERRSLAAQIDTNGDGQPDATRRANVVPLMRT
ncbi:MAG: hypothetical protein KF805_05935 [Phycisphaeraceae bacterium]|nr:hypothetical protein [Phycisphaeraceae bacterium]